MPYQMGIEVWPESELKTIISGSEGHRLHLLLLLAANIGCRIGELLALRYDDISDSILKINKQIVIVDVFKDGIKSGQKIQISETKTAASIRSILLDTPTIKAIDEHKKWHKAEMMENGYRTEYIFTTKTGNFAVFFCTLFWSFREPITVILFFLPFFAFCAQI